VTLFLGHRVGVFYTTSSTHSVTGRLSTLTLATSQGGPGWVVLGGRGSLFLAM